MNEIINKVAKSTLVTFDVEDYKPFEKMVALDICMYLFEGLILKEKDFRKTLKETDFSVYQDQNIALFCSTDAIIPLWSYLLISSYLEPFVKEIRIGSLEEFQTYLFQKNIENIDYSVFTDLPVIVKGCSEEDIPIQIINTAFLKLKKVAKSVFFGEACSSVPIYKKPK